jgi:hypothetical protein
MFVGKPYIMGHTAEFIAQMEDISREEMDEVALRSHNNAERATRDGSFRRDRARAGAPAEKRSHHVRQGRAFPAGHDHGGLAETAGRPSFPKSARSRPAIPAASTTAQRP